MGNCENIQVMKDGVCIAESLGRCRGCANEFFKDLEEDGWGGLRIDEDGIKPFGQQP